MWPSQHGDFPGPASRVQFVTHWAKLIEQHAESGADWPTGRWTMLDMLLWINSEAAVSLD